MNTVKDMQYVAQAIFLIFTPGYIVSRVKLAGEKAPIFKQLKWYEGRQEHILDVVLDPLGEWLACACLSGDLYLVPILPLMMVCKVRTLANGIL